MKKEKKTVHNLWRGERELFLKRLFFFFKKDIDIGFFSAKNKVKAIFYTFFIISSIFFSPFFMDSISSSSSSDSSSSVDFDSLIGKFFLKKTCSDPYLPFW